MRASDDSPGAASTAGRTPEVVVTSCRSAGRFLVLVRCRAIRLAHGPLNLLLTLMLAQTDPRGEGFVRDRLTAYPVAVHRLRKALDEQLGDGVGRRLIETGVGWEYRLAAQISAAVDRRLLASEDAAPDQTRRELARRCALLEAEDIMELLSDCGPPVIDL